MCECRAGLVDVVVCVSMQTVRWLGWDLAGVGGGGQTGAGGCRHLDTSLEPAPQNMDPGETRNYTLDTIDM